MAHGQLGFPNTRGHTKIARHLRFIIAGMPRHKKAFASLSMTDAELLEAALIGLERRRSEIEEKMAELRQRLDDRAGRPARSAAAVNTAAPMVPKKRTRSAAVRRRMGAAQRKRWAELKKARAENAAPIKKRQLSAAGRKRIIAATKKRWAEYNAKKRVAGKKSAKTVRKKTPTTG